MNKKKYFSFSGEAKDSAIFSFFFCFKRELNPYSPLTYSLTSAHKPPLSSLYELIPSSLRPPMNQDMSKKISNFFLLL